MAQRHDATHEDNHRSLGHLPRDGGIPAPPIGVPAQEEQFSSRIPAADHQKFKSIRDAKDWSNPYLVVCADGIEVISKAVPSGRKLVAPADLRRTLVGLPANKQAAEAALKALRLELEWWPSA